MTNTGKIFEKEIADSIPEYALLYRLPDSAQSFGGGNNLRFSRKNPFDFLMWDSAGRTLYALEMKTVNEKSISFERSKEDKGKIHYHQIDGLNKWSKYGGIVCGFIIEFRPIEETIFILIDDFNTLMDKVEKKSFTIGDLDKLEIPYIVIPQTKMRTRYRYDIDGFINSTRKLVWADGGIL